MIYWIIFLFLPFVFLMLITISDKIFIKSSKYGFQKFKQFMVYFIEMYIIIFIGVSIITYFESDSFIFWQSDDSFFEFFQRGLAIFSTYQLFIFAILQLSISADKDSLLAYKKVLRLTIHSIDNHKELNKIKDFIETNYTSAMYSNKIRKSLYNLTKTIEEYIDNDWTRDYREKLSSSLKFQIIDIEHTLDTYNLAWMNSFLLYKLK